MNNQITFVHISSESGDHYYAAVPDMSIEEAKATARALVSNATGEVAENGVDEDGYEVWATLYVEATFTAPVPLFEPTITDQEFVSILTGYTKTEKEVK